MADAYVVATHQPVVGNCDWLAWSVRGVDATRLPTMDFKFSHRHRRYICKYYAGTASYARRYVCFTEDADKVFTLLCAPKSKLFAPDTGLVEVANEWLYHGLGWEGVWAVVCAVCPCVRYGFSRWDFAFDFTPDRRQRCLIQYLAIGRAYIANKRNGTCWWSIDGADGCPSIYRGKKIPHCQSWGHKSSAVKWKLYYKSKELAEPSGWKGWEKPYIVDQWRQAGLDERNVWRLEVSLHHGNGFEVSGGLHRINYGMNRSEMERLARSLIASRFIMRLQQGHKDKRHDREVQFWENWPYLMVRCAKSEVGRLTDARHALLRRLIDALHTEDITTSRTLTDGVVRLASEVIQFDHLQEYARALLDGMEWDDFVATLPADGDQHHHPTTDHQDITTMQQIGSRVFESHRPPTTDPPADLFTL